MSTLGDREQSAAVRAGIRRRLCTGALPALAPHHRIYAGYGEQQPCHACGEPIERSEVLYEIDVGAAPARGQVDDPSVRVLAMHLACFDLWVDESGRGGGPGDSGSSGGDGSACLKALEEEPAAGGGRLIWS